MANGIKRFLNAFRQGERPEISDPSLSRPRSGATEPDAIYAEVERRKKRAEELRVREIAWSLYHHRLEWYPEQFKQKSEMIFPSVTDAIQPERGQTQIEIVTRKLLFAYTERGSYADYTNSVGTLALCVNDQQVLEFDIWIELPKQEYDETVYTVSTIHAFIEGPWITELKELLAQIESHEKTTSEALRKKAREDPGTLEDLKKKFGI
jgi:hypothetical protein